MTAKMHMTPKGLKPCKAVQKACKYSHHYQPADEFKAVALSQAVLDMLTDGFQTVHDREVEADSSSSAERLKVLAKDPEFLVRLSVAGNKHTPGDVLVALASERRELRWAAASNPSCPATLVKDLSKRDDWVLAKVLLQRSDLTPKDRNRLVESLSD